MEIRSYRAVFDLERRIYRVDRIRLNPAGVPVRGVVYALAAIATVLICVSLPPLAPLARLLPWYLLDLALPVGAAALLTVIRIDGRPFHLAAQALLCHRIQPRQSVGLRPARAGRGAEPGARWWPPPILLLPDGSDARIRRLRYTGPGAVLVTVAHACAGGRGRGLSLRLRPGAGWAGLGRARVTLRALPAGDPRAARSRAGTTEGAGADKSACAGEGAYEGAGKDEGAGKGASEGAGEDEDEGAGEDEAGADTGGKVIALAPGAVLIAR